MPATPHPKAKVKNTGGEWFVLVVLLIVVAIVIAFIVSVASSGSHAKLSTSWQATPVSSSVDAVNVTVTNDGANTVTPQCNITLASPNYTYSGVDTITATQSLDPGSSATYPDSVTISGHGAKHIAQSSSSVKCS